MSLFKEAMQAPRDQLSFKQNAYDLFQGRYTYVASQHDDLLLTIRSDLTKSIPSILPMIQEETEYGLDMEFGDCAQWKPVPLFPTVLRLMALMSGRVFVGLPLSRNEEWIKASLDYMQDVIALMHASQKWNHLVRPFVIPFLGEFRKVRRDLSTACRMVRPVVAEAISRETTAAEAGTRGSFISWMLKYQPGDRHLANKVGNSQMAVSVPRVLSVHGC
jgi:cytochrome P450 monooxygenase-3